ncbi:MAG: ROK family protein [Planctomycetes bacterium]|nr:ROK family protein [Planctomycetota bacterium]MCB9871398.1 ROK family protein [Planctomycetota bacterium]MCB9888649.1 ROK family protein [Planctomycetota bacterium]
MNTTLAADLGGTKCRFALVASDGTLHADRRRATPRGAEDLHALFARELAAVRDAPRPGGWAEPRSVGVGVAGVVAEDHRTVVYAPNLALDGIDLQNLLGARSLPVRALNDGRACALGEYSHGDAAGEEPLLVLLFGSGIGIGWIVGGQPFAGHSNAAGEAGHLEHVPGGRTCPCGRRGCFEAYCGGKPMVERAADVLGPGPTEGGWTVGDVLRVADTQPAAAAILGEARVAACTLVASLCTLLNPGAVVLGGGVLRGWPELANHIEEHVRQRCAAVVTRALRFVRSRGEADAVLWGAAAFAGPEAR